MLRLETVRGQEMLGRAYKFHPTLDCISREPGSEPDDVLGKPLAAGIKLVTGEDRYFHGVVTGFVKTSTTHLHTRYVAELLPMLSLFDHTFDCRIFNGAPAQEVPEASRVANCRLKSRASWRSAIPASRIHPTRRDHGRVGPP
jgi:type VI secretion system secreted protein VgrG